MNTRFFSDAFAAAEMAVSVLRLIKTVNSYKEKRIEKISGSCYNKNGGDSTTL